MEGRYSGLATILRLVRSEVAVTRPEIARHADLGRAIVSQRVEEAIELGLLVDAELAASKGGRMPRVLRMKPRTAVVAGVVFGVTRIHVAVADLTGEVLASELRRWDVHAGPRDSLALAAAMLRDLLTGMESAPPLWGIVLGVPMPVEFPAGRPLLDPALPEWGQYPLRDWLEHEFDVPVWVDTEVNLMAYGEWRNSPSGFGDELLLVKCGTSLSSGLVTHGRVHRGIRSAAGRIGHMIYDRHSTMRCTCGKAGCLEAVASGWAVAAEAERLVAEGATTALADIARERRLTIDDVTDAADAHDELARTLLHDAGRAIGASIADLVTFYNPSAVVLGGSMAVGDLIEGVRSALFQNASTLSLDGLAVSQSFASHQEGVIGSASLGVDELFSAAQLERWADRRTPIGLSSSLRHPVEAITD